MSFPRAPLVRCNERSVSKTALKSPSKEKPKTAGCGSMRVTVSKTSVTKQRSNSSTYRTPERSRVRLGSYASAVSLEGNRSWAGRSKSGAKERLDGSPSPQRKVDALAVDTGEGSAAPDGGGGGGGGGGGTALSSSTPSQSTMPSSTRMAQNAARRRVLETQFAMKSKRFAQLRKEILERQRTMAGLHNTLCDMHERLCTIGAKDLPTPEALPLVEAEAVALATEQALKQAKAMKMGSSSSRGVKRCRSSRARLAKGGEGDEEGFDGEDSGDIDDDLFDHLRGPTEEALTQVEEQLRAVPTWCMEACREALTKRAEVLNWVTELNSAKHMLDEENCLKLADFKREGDATEAELEGESHAQLEAVDVAVETVRALAAETEAARSDYEQAAEHARQQLQQLQEHQQHAALAQTQAHAEAQRALIETHKQLQEAQEATREQACCAQGAAERANQLEKQLNVAAAQLNASERHAQAASSEAHAEHERYRIVAEQLNLVDCYLKEERGRVRELEGRLSADEARIKKLNAQMSALEEHLRGKDAQHEARLHALHAEAQANAETARKLEAQKDALERRVQDLGAILAGQDREEMMTLGQMKENREEIRKLLEKEKELRLTAQTELEREKHRIAELEGRAGQLTDALRAAGNAADENSAALAQELDDMKRQLRETLMKVASLEDERIIQEESVRKLELRQHREREEKQLLSAELQQKEQQLGAAQAQLRELRGRAEAQRDRVLQLERQLSLARTARPLEQALQQQQQDFHKKVTDLQNALKEVVRHNDELERAVMHKQQEVEQRERVMREQAKVLKVRDELIVLLKSKEQRQEETVDLLRAQTKEQGDVMGKVTSEMELKMEELTQVYAALETKQLQVTKLEALVKQLEDQQERSQAQRTRQEARISSLEMLLQTHEQPQRYARSSPSSDSPPPSPPWPPRHPPPSYFFWDGRELKQIERIPAGAQQSPPKGTFYLTVNPNADRTSHPDESPELKFSVTANMGTGDVEEGLGSVDVGMEETLARAADAAVTLAAFVAVEAGRQAMAGGGDVSGAGSGDAASGCGAAESALESPSTAPGALGDESAADASATTSANAQNYPWTRANCSAKNFNFGGEQDLAEIFSLQTAVQEPAAMPCSPENTARWVSNLLHCVEEDVLVDPLAGRPPATAHTCMLPGVRLRGGASEPCAPRTRPASAPAAPIAAVPAGTQGAQAVVFFGDAQDCFQFRTGTSETHLGWVEGECQGNQEGFSITEGADNTSEEFVARTFPSNGERGSINICQYTNRSEPFHQQNGNERNLGEDKNECPVEISHNVPSAVGAPFGQNKACKEESATIEAARMQGDEGSPREWSGPQRAPPRASPLPRAPSPNAAWVPWASDDDTAGAGAVSVGPHAAGEHGNEETDSSDFSGLGFQLFFPEAPWNGTSAGEDRHSPWFAYMSQSPPAARPAEADRASPAFVTAPVEQSAESFVAVPRDVRRAARLPLLSAPAAGGIGAGVAGRLDGGEGTALQSEAPAFTVEVAGGPPWERPPRPPAHRPLSTIDEVTSESRDRSDSKRCATSEDMYTVNIPTAHNTSRASTTFDVESIPDETNTSDVSMKVAASDTPRLTAESKHTLDSDDMKRFTSSVGGSYEKTRGSSNAIGSTNEETSLVNGCACSSRDAADGSPSARNVVPKSREASGSRPRRALKKSRCLSDSSDTSPCSAHHTTKCRTRGPAANVPQVVNNNTISNLGHEQSNCTGEGMGQKIKELNQQLPVAEMQLKKDNEGILPCLKKINTRSKFSEIFCIGGSSHGTVHRLFNNNDDDQLTTVHDKDHGLDVGEVNQHKTHFQSEINTCIPIHCRRIQNGSRVGVTCNHRKEASPTDPTIGCCLPNTKIRLHSVVDCNPNKDHVGSECVANSNSIPKLHKNHCQISDRSVTKVMEKARSDKEFFNYTSKQKHHTRAVTQSISNIYAILHTETTESFEDSDSQSENLNDYDTEDSYEIDVPTLYRHPIHVSMQCMETYECHTKQCQHSHW